MLFKESEREFVITRKASIKPVFYFTGRETELNALSQRIEGRQRSVLVSGMGGIGKTQICRKMFEKYLIQHNKEEKSLFSHIGYIEYDGNMNSSLENCLKYKMQKKTELNQEAAWRELEYLSQDGKLLLFVDNVDKTIFEDPGLKRLNSIPGTIILTSRQVSFSDEFEPYEIGFLSMEHCVELYERIRFWGSGRKIRPCEMEDLKYIIEKLSARHTITIEHLAYLARTKIWSVNELRRELDDKKFCLEYHKNGELVNIQQSYEKLYDMFELNTSEKMILEAFSLFPYLPLPAGICNLWLLEDAGVCEDDDILTGLYQKGWLQFDMEQESYTLHPVYAQVIYESCKPEISNHGKLTKACKESVEVPEDGSVIECRQYLPFVEEIIRKLEAGKSTEMASLMFSVGYLSQYMSEYKKAEKYYIKSLSIYKEVLGEESSDTALCYNNLASVYVRDGRYEEAERTYKKGLAIQEKILGEDNFYTTSSYNNLAYVYRVQGNLEEAKRLYEKSLKIREQMYGNRHMETARCYDGLAEAFRKMKDYEQAESLSRKSLDIRKDIQGDKHPDTAVGYSNLASLYAETGKYEEAEDLFEKSLDIHKTMLGGDHTKTAVTYCSLASVYEKKGEFEKAIEYNLEGYKILSLKVEPSHRNYKKAYQNLERCFLRLNPKGCFEKWLENEMD